MRYFNAISIYIYKCGCSVRYCMYTLYCVHVHDGALQFTTYTELKKKTRRTTRENDFQVYRGCRTIKRLKSRFKRNLPLSFSKRNDWTVVHQATFNTNLYWLNVCRHFNWHVCANTRQTYCILSLPEMHISSTKYKRVRIQFANIPFCTLDASIIIWNGFRVFGSFECISIGKPNAVFCIVLLINTSNAHFS